MHKITRLLKTLALIIPLALFLGCGSSVEVTGEQVTMGKELTDLNQAYESGVIDRKEYEEAKKRILEDK